MTDTLEEAVATNNSLYDKNGRPLLIGDVLKVFHFIGARRKKHYMYKQVDSIELLGKNKVPFFRINHLASPDDDQ